MDSAGRPDDDALMHSLVQAGAAARAPGPFAYLESLARRRQAYIGLARQRLDERLRAGAVALLAELGARPDDGAEAGPFGRGAGDVVEPGLLAALVAALNARSGDEGAGVPGAAVDQGAASAAVNAAPAAAELKAVRQHRQAWARLKVGQQLQQSVAQAPDNPGPLNSQALVLRALQALQDDAPDYLQALVAQVESLWWLEQVAVLSVPAAGRMGRRQGKHR